MSRNKRNKIRRQAKLKELQAKNMIRMMRLFGEPLEDQRQVIGTLYQYGGFPKAIRLMLELPVKE